MLRIARRCETSVRDVLLESVDQGWSHDRCGYRGGWSRELLSMTNRSCCLVWCAKSLSLTMSRAYRRGRQLLLRNLLLELFDKFGGNDEPVGLGHANG